MAVSVAGQPSRSSAAPSRCPAVLPGWQGGEAQRRSTRPSHAASRLKQPPPEDDWADGVLRVARNWKDKRYDSLFEWSDDKVYCSELVWKAFDRGANVQIVTPQHIGDLDLFWPPVKALIKARLPGKSPDLEEPIVTPGHLHDSELLETIVGWVVH